MAATMCSVVTLSAAAAAAAAPAGRRRPAAAAAFAAPRAAFAAPRALALLQPAARRHRAPVERRPLRVAADDSASTEQVVSPFEAAEQQQPEVATYGELTEYTVNLALDVVRPYLVADGGNVEVVAVDADAGLVQLKFQGACGSCPSSAETMQLGLEKTLRSAFGDLIKKVEEIKDEPKATVQLVDKFLDQLRPAINHYKAEVVVKEVADGVCNIDYKGPPMIAPGIRDAVKEGFPDLETVNVEILEESA